MYDEESIGLGQSARNKSDPLERERKYKSIRESWNWEEQSCNFRGHNMVVTGGKWNYEK
jgi:hypothetical protein